MSSNSCCKSLEAAGWRRWLVLGALLLSGLCGAASWRDDLPQAERLGDGELSWLGFRIYHATLWAQQRPFQQQAAFALQLRYYRDISRQRLVQTSLDEMRRLRGAGLDPATLAQWKGALQRAFTDVASGDELIGVYLPGHGMRLYNQQQLLADIDDIGLARAFFGIWLDRDTRDQELRRKLMGAPQ
ncbi:MAG: chalcone isomerase family protein [Pseudomonadota bacterium]